jgi:hypothetical protein
MNIQDVVTFLELIKDPTVFEQRVQRLVDEQNKLNSLIETVGKVSDINSMRELAGKRVQEADDLLEKAKADSEKIRETAANTYVKRNATLDKREAVVQEQLQKSLEALETAQQIEASFAATSKELKERERIVLEREQKAVVLEQELQERLEKLRSVMG